jgi:alkylation response protein AidB-like acyl-CoA dehydrogenase
MSLPDRNNPYSFDEFVDAARAFDFYLDDPFLRAVVMRYGRSEWPTLHERISEFSRKVSFQWRELADRAAHPEQRPWLEPYDAYNCRVDRIHRSPYTEALETEVFRQALFSSRTPPWESFCKRFLLQQIGEAGVCCSLACTEGLIAALEYYGDASDPRVAQVLRHCKEGVDGAFGIGAQFVTEIHGGSDIPANRVEAEPCADGYRLYGNKFFCSAVHADYAIVTAKVTGSDKVGAFLVPMWGPGERRGGRRNGYRINRLKWKMGTVELPTAEIDFDGAVAYAVGPTDRGVATVVGIVLSLSRVSVAMSSAGFMLRAAREATLYSRFREAFGRRLDRFPLAAAEVASIQDAARRATAGVFKIHDLYLQLGRKLQPGLESDEPLDTRRKRFDLRELILLQKMTTAREAVDVLRTAISILGGHGVIEDFSSLPRLFRDATVNELWEGPRNVLLAQVHRDLQRAAPWYPPEDLVAAILDGRPDGEVRLFQRELKEFLADSPFDGPDARAMERATRWGEFCDRLFKAYQTAAVEEVGHLPLVAEA